ncbi:MAG: hypothetical protein ACTSWW_11965 [Promethearchaeota archaeon]
MNQFKRLITGNFNQKELRTLILGSIILGGLNLLIARILYPPELNYSIFTDTISYLGDYIRNPSGWVFLSITFFIVGGAFILLTLYIHRRVVKIQPFIARVGSVSLLIGSVGVFLTAFLPDDHGGNFIEDVSMGKVHNIVAMFAMFGLLVGLTLYGMLFLINHYPRMRGSRKRYYTDVRTMPVFLLIVFAGFSMLATLLIMNREGYEWPGPGLLSFTFWEWVLTGVFCLNIYRLAWKLPNS